MIKTIVSNVFPPIENPRRAMEITQETLTEMLSLRFPSEHNMDQLEYASRVMDGYCYVPSPLTLWEGRYTRYLDMNNAYKMNLKLGGFVIEDSGTIVTIRNKSKIFRVNKQNKLWFMTITDNDLKYATMKSLFNRSKYYVAYCVYILVGKKSKRTK